MESFNKSLPALPYDSAANDMQDNIEMDALATALKDDEYYKDKVMRFARGIQQRKEHLIKKARKRRAKNKAAKKARRE